MFKQNFKKILLIILSLVLISFVLTACGEKEPDRTRKYVIVTDNYGTEYRVNHSNTFKVPFINEKAYGFTYIAYYEDNDEPTGEEGFFDLGDVSEPGEYVAFCDILHTQGFTFTFLIEELPLSELTIKLDSSNAIRYVDKESYVYDYDMEGEKYPTALLYDGETHLEEYDNLVTYHFVRLETNSVVQSPKHMGLYEVKYYVMSFENKERTKKYKGVEIKFTIELIKL